MTLSPVARTAAVLALCDREGSIVVVRGRMDAQIHDLYVAQPLRPRGRPRKWGERLSLSAYAADEKHFTNRVYLYQERMEVRVTYSTLRRPLAMAASRASRWTWAGNLVPC